VDKTELLLQELTEAHGVPGHEEQVAKIMAEHLKGVAGIEHDRLGSFIAKKTGTSPKPKVMIAGHMDEVGPRRGSSSFSLSGDGGVTSSRLRG